MPNSLSALPPEMQARIAAIMAGNSPDVSPHQAAIADVPPQPPVPQATEAPAPVAKPLSLMDHVIALRGEVAELRQFVGAIHEQLDANSQVTEAVGNAVGQIYQMFQATPSPETYSQQFQYQASPDQSDF